MNLQEHLKKKKIISTMSKFLIKSIFKIKNM